MTDATVPQSHTDETARLGMWDAVSIIVGIVVGTSIYKSPRLIFGSVDDAWIGMGAWALGGVLSLIGALCYAELATAYPRMGGDYVYLSRAFGKWVGFLFGWGQLAVILTGSIGVMAYAFGDYAVNLWGLEPDATVWFALGAVVVISAMNLVGVVFGKHVQNVLSGLKVVGLLAIVIAGFGLGGEVSLQSSHEITTTNFGFAMVMVLYAFGGWNDAAFVASEVRDRHRNIPRALIFGIGGITIVYLLVNLGYLWGLGFDKMRESWTPAADVLKGPFGENGSRVMSILVMLSALGAVNGLVLTGSRIYTALGREHSVFKFLGRWDPRLGVPIWSIVVQAAISVLLILAVGTPDGRNTIDNGLQKVGLDGLPWTKYFGGFETLFAGTAPVFWIFFLLTGISLFILRSKDPHIERPFVTPLYPLIPLLFCATSAYMLYSSLTYAKTLSLLGFVPLMIGLPLYFISRYTPDES
jgi:basic amino acid/polyamine antiporter, APA family